MRFFHKRKKYYMNVQDADNTLKNVLAACDMKPNTIPIDKLLLRKKLSTAPYNICMKIILVQFFIVLLFPAVVFLLF